MTVPTVLYVVGSADLVRPMPGPLVGVTVAVASLDVTVCPFWVVLAVALLTIGPLSKFAWVVV